MANNFKVRDLIADNVIINGDITTVDSITFDTAAVETSAVGKFKWNDEDGTLDLGLKGGNVTLQVGQETVIRAVNKTNTNLLEANYQVARIRTEAEGGTQGQRLAIVLAQANNDNNSVDTLGLVTENIDNNEEGFVTTFGLVRGIDTTGSLQGEDWNDGDVLYLSPTIAGRLTKVKPEAPQHTVIVGFVVYSHQNNGKIFVKVDNGYEINELHNVKINGVTNNNVLAYDSALSVWKNTNTINVDSVTANNLVYTTGDQTIAGVKTFSDNIISNGISSRLPNQEMIPSTPKDSIITKANYLAMNLFEAGRVFEVQASASLIRTDTGSGTSVGSANFVHGIGSINIGNYTTSTIRMILAAANWMYSTGTGATLNYALPWAISFKFFHFLRDPNTVHRIYIGTNSNNTSFPLPLKGADAYPTGGFRGIGIEFRKDPDNLYGTQCRLFARNGYNQGGVVDGTFVASDWTALWPNSNVIGPAHHLILTNDGVGNIALFANNWNGNSSLPSMTSRIPLITLSGTGVPVDQKSVLTNWGNIEMCMVNDGVNSAVPSSNQMNMYPMKIQIGNLL